MPLTCPAPILFLGGWLQKAAGYSLGDTATLLGLPFAVGVAQLPFAPETRGRDLEG